MSESAPAKKRGRPTLFGKAMSVAERQRRHRSITRTVAGLLVTTEAIVAEKPKPKAPLSAKIRR